MYDGLYIICYTLFVDKLKVNLDSEQAVKEEKTVEQPPVSVTEPKLAAPPAQKKSSRKSEPGKVQQKEKRWWEMLSRDGGREEGLVEVRWSAWAFCNRHFSARH